LPKKHAKTPAIAYAPRRDETGRFDGAQALSFTEAADHLLAKIEHEYPYARPYALDALRAVLRLAKASEKLAIQYGVMEAKIRDVGRRSAEDSA